MQFFTVFRDVSAAMVKAWLLLMLTACAPSLNWREVRAPQGQGLVLMFPCKPEHRERQVAVQGLSGGSATMHLLSCQANGATWALSYLDAGTPERWRQAPQALSDALWANLSQGPASGERERQDLGPTTVPGMTPHAAAHTWRMRGQRPVSVTQYEAVQVQAWHFSKGLSVFQASVWAPALREDDPGLKAFESGFNFPS